MPAHESLTRASSRPAARAENIGFIGLGDMGEPMAHNLVAAGFSVTVFDTRAAPLQLASDKGAKVAATLAEMPACCSIIGICVWSEDQLTSLLYDAGGLFSSDAQRVTLLIHSTVTPQLVERIAATCRERDWQVIDAPVSGGRAGSLAGTLTIMAGGDKDAFEQCTPYFDAVAKNVFHIGARAGSGAVAKLCNNLMALTNIFAVAESLKLAAAYGIQEDAILKAARVSTGNSWWIENWGFFDNLIATHAQPDVLSKDLWEAVQAGQLEGLELAIARAAAEAAPGLTRDRLANLATRKNPSARD